MHLISNKNPRRPSPVPRFVPLTPGIFLGCFPLAFPLSAKPLAPEPLAAGEGAQQFLRCKFAPSRFAIRFGVESEICPKLHKPRPDWTD